MKRIAFDTERRFVSRCQAGPCGENSTKKDKRKRGLQLADNRDKLGIVSREVVTLTETQKAMVCIFPYLFHW
jgi:hypothetical protein